MSRVEHIVFYGTLVSGGKTSLYPFLRDSLGYVTTCLIPGKLYNLGRMPGLKPGNLRIHGKLYKIITPEIIAVIDEYEAIDNEDPSLPGFSRGKVTLLEPKLEAWVYYYDGEVDPEKLIKSNHWQA